MYEREELLQQQPQISFNKEKVPETLFEHAKRRLSPIRFDIFAIITAPGDGSAHDTTYILLKTQRRMRAPEHIS